MKGSSSAGLVGYQVMELSGAHFKIMCDHESKTETNGKLFERQKRTDMEQFTMCSNGLSNHSNG